jgi:hypothetical protein
MGEVIKTMMESGTAEKDPNTVELMHLAVSSIFARQYWENDLCIPTPAAFSEAPIAEWTIEFK